VSISAGERLLLGWNGAELREWMVPSPDLLKSNLNPKLQSGNEIGLLIHLRADGYNVLFRYSSPG
jgi:hypothetical protein